MHYLYERSQNESHPLRQPDTATRCTVLEKSSFVSGYGSPSDLGRDRSFQNSAAYKAMMSWNRCNEFRQLAPQHKTNRFFFSIPQHDRTIRRYRTDTPVWCRTCPRRYASDQCVEYCEVFECGPHAWRDRLMMSWNRCNEFRQLAPQHRTNRFFQHPAARSNHSKIPYRYTCLVPNVFETLRFRPVRRVL
jgi:hypothetical protein